MTSRLDVTLFSGIAFCLLISGTVDAATISVPADQPTIQGAINSASDGDVIEVASGTYFENINFEGKAITVSSSSGPTSTTIDGGQKASVVTFSSSETTSSVLSGFTITHGLGNGSGGGIFIANSSPSISGNIISENEACGPGDGIFVNFGSPLIIGNTITGNHPGGCTSDGAGIAIFGAGAAQIISNTISNNRAGSGGGIEISGDGTFVIENNLISGNSVSGVLNSSVQPASSGGGIYYNGNDAHFVQNLVVNNIADLGGGIYYAEQSGSGMPLLVNNTVAGNTSTQNLGSAVFADGFAGPSELFNNLLIGGSQNAVFCNAFYNSIPPVFENNDVFSTTAGFEGSCTNSAGHYANISSDPLFANPGANDYHLISGSPAIDTGTNQAPDLLATDYYGNPRIVGGAPGNRAIVDMGIVEYQANPPGPTPAATPTPMFGSIINVPADVSSIQGGIDAAKNGDTVRVAPGTYFEAINFEGKAIQVVSTAGPQQTIIDGHGLSSVVSFVSGESTSTILSGFTITNGLADESATGGGIFITNSSPTVTENIITGNEACGGGGGISILNGSPVVQSNVIESNSQEANAVGFCSGGGGGGILVGGVGFAQILSNTIADNSWQNGDGGGIAVNGGAPLLMNNLITGNLASGISGSVSGINGPISRGGGLLILSSNAQIIQNVIADNTADLGAGIGMDLSRGSSTPFVGGPLIVNNTIVDNHATEGDGSELFGDFTTETQIANNLLVATGSQSALYCAKDPNLRIAQFPIVRNNDAFSNDGKASDGKCPFPIAANGNISRDPLLVDPASQNFHLQLGSPAIDAGTNSALDIPNSDYYNVPRIVPGQSHDQSIVDIGASEFQPAGLPSPAPTPLCTAPM